MAAQLVAAGGCGILDLGPDGSIYMAVYSYPTSTRVVLRTAADLAGLWSSAVAVCRARRPTTGTGWVYDALAHV
jgi:hypothetical protein